MNLIKTPEQLAGIRASSQLAAQTLLYLSKLLQPGISTLFLDQKAVEFIGDHHAVAAPLNYKGFPKSICTSINNVVCHGIPKSTDILKDGDIINLDVTTILNKYYGDTSASYGIGGISPLAQKLLTVTKQAMYASIACLRPNKYLNDCVGKIIQPFVEKNGFSVVRELGGHGVGLSFHEDMFIYHYDMPHHDVLLQPGMTFTIEPMVNASHNHNIVLDRNDGWTIYTADRSLSAQFEHTVAITREGVEILTKLN